VDPYAEFQYIFDKFASAEEVTGQVVVKEEAGAATADLEEPEEKVGRLEHLLA
jgi:hypothetical protein